MDAQKALDNLTHLARSSLFFPDKFAERTIRESERVLKKVIKEEEMLEKIRDKMGFSPVFELTFDEFTEDDYRRYENLTLTKSELERIIECLYYASYSDIGHDIERKTLLTKLVLYREGMGRRK